MDTWNPVQLLIAQYLVASAAAFGAILTSKEPFSIRGVIGPVVRFGLLGGTAAPILAAIVPLPAAVTKTERLLFWAGGVGGGFVAVPVIGNWMEKLLTAQLPRGQGNAPDTGADAGS